MELPGPGLPADELFSRMRERKAADADWRGGRTFSLIYPASPEIDAVLQEANLLYLYENALNPFRFPSLKHMEDEVVSMTTSMLNGPDTAGGSMTSGGTESILMAVKTARDRSGVERPSLVAPASAHPAFAKACHYLGLDLRPARLRDDLRCDVDHAASLVDGSTVLMVGSAPGYPHGVIDPIAELAVVASERGISFHTDACVGGFLLPFMERLGHPVPPWDFRVPGVTTISADVHKYGYTTKGASVIAHRDRDGLKHQGFLYDSWPGGLYGSWAMAGARAASPIAAAWAVMSYLGWDGYCAQVTRVMDATARIKQGITDIPGLHLWGEPDASVLAFGSTERDIFAIGDVMDDRGWHLDRQNGPDALHMMVSPAHDAIVDEFLSDLEEASATASASRGVRARYS